MFKKLFTTNEVFITRLVNDGRETLQKKYPQRNIEYMKMNDFNMDPVKEVFELDLGRDGKLVWFLGADNSVQYDIVRNKKTKYGKKQTKLKS